MLIDNEVNNEVKSYLNSGNNKQCYELCEKVLYNIEKLMFKCEPHIYIDILFSYYVSSFYHNQSESLKIVNHIYDVCNNNSIIKTEFDKNKGFYESQFKYCNELKPKYKIIINILACATVEKYKQQILKINETWGKKAEENGIKILFFLGEEKTDLIDENKYIYLKDVKNDYNSAAYKQNLGLKYIYENYNADFIFTCGTDTYINIDNLLFYINNFDSNKKLYIGGHGYYRMLGNDNIYFHSGGAGFILSKAVLSEFYSQLYNIQNDWTILCCKNNYHSLTVACDVLIGYYVSKIINIEIIKNDNFYQCNYKGYENNNTCCVNKIIKENIISCHCMSLTDFDEYTNIINSPCKICFITAIYGNYEASCKKFISQTVKTDFICFTDNPNIISNGWKIDNTPYHLINKSELDNVNYINSLNNNKHTFNIAKYYKQSFKKIPILKKYDVIVWLDGTIEIVYDKTSEYVLNNIYKEKIIGWNHEYRHGILSKEVNASHGERYTSTFWNGQNQPYQDVDKQYEEYLKDGYNDLYFKNKNSHSKYFGVWITCFIAFLKNDTEVHDFLNLWYLQTLTYTTQDQISFSYVCQKTNLLPYTLPNSEIKGDFPHNNTQFYIKHDHGK